MTALTVDIRRKSFPARDRSHPQLVISDLSFSVAKSEFVCIVGPSGCGKTTLLNLIAGLDTAFEGAVSIVPGLRESLTYVFQTPRLLPWRTVRQNVQLADPGNDDGGRRVADMIAAVGLRDFSGHFPGQLSLGMQRRASLARAFVRKPSLLLMDEPFVSLDTGAADRLRALLAGILADQPATVLFVTHDHREAVRLADRIIVLSAGPASVVHDIPVPLTQDQRSSDVLVSEFCKRALDSITAESSDANTNLRAS